MNLRSIEPQPNTKAQSARLHENDSASLRNTGLPFITHVPWGSHLSIFYETREDLIDTNVGYFEAGLKNNEFCIWAISDPITEKAVMPLTTVFLQLVLDRKSYKRDC